MSDGAKNPWAILHKALYDMASFGVIGETSNEKQYRFTGRVPQETMSIWLDIVDLLYECADAEDWTVDVSKLYFRASNIPQVRGRTRLRYTWRIILQGSELEGLAAKLANEVGNVKPTPQQRSPRQVVEVALRGGINRNDPSRQRGKGAQNALTAVTGEAQRKRMGL